MLKSWLFVPASRERFLEKATTLPLDAIILDLEDAVSERDKATARRNAVAWINKGQFQGAVFVRVNGLDTLHLMEDLQSVVSGGLAGVLLPKAESSKDIHIVDFLLSQWERRKGLPEGTVKLVPIIESGKGLHDAYSIATAAKRVQCLAFGIEDYKLGLGIRTDGGAEQFLYVRSKLAEVSSAAGIEAPIDSIFKDFRNEAGFASESAHSRELGFQGKLLVHPDQINISHQVFGPTAEEIEEAREIVKQYGNAKESGTAAISVGGQMVDVPVAERAKKLLEQVGEYQSGVVQG